MTTDALGLVPMRWPAKQWPKPEMLSLLKGTPVNCVVFESTEGCEPVIKAAKASSIMDAGLVKGTAPSPDPDAGLSLLVSVRERAKLGKDKLAAVSDNVWPGIQSMQGSTQAAPTGTPWLDSNSWFLRLARAQSPGTTFWLLADPPADENARRSERYALSVIDAAAHGGRWVISLDAALAAGLASGNTTALDAWKRITAAAAFFERHAVWDAFDPIGAVAVLSDFAGENEMMGGELLNLMARRQLPHRILCRESALSAAFSAYRAIITMDAGDVATPLRDKLLSFARDGGLLITGPQWKLEGAPAENHPRFRVLRYGKGRVAVSAEKEPDPYVVAADAHILLSHANDVLRIHNVGSMSSYYSAAPDGKSDVLHLVSYSARRSASAVTIWVKRKYREARLWRLTGDRPEPLRATEEGNGYEYYLPPIADYAAIEFGA